MSTSISPKASDAHPKRLVDVPINDWIGDSRAASSELASSLLVKLHQKFDALEHKRVRVMSADESADEVEYITYPMLDGLQDLSSDRISKTARFNRRGHYKGPHMFTATERSHIAAGGIVCSRGGHDTWVAAYRETWGGVYWRENDELTARVDAELLSRQMKMVIAAKLSDGASDDASAPKRRRMCV